MPTKVGLWIDHRETVLVTIGDGGEETKRIDSGMEKHTRFSGGSRSEEAGRKTNGVANSPAISTLTMMR